MNCVTSRFQSVVGASAEKVRTSRQLIDTLFSLVGINLFVAGLSFFTTLLIANVLGRERFGDLSYAIAVGGYCVTIACCGTDRTLIRDLVHFPKRFDTYVSANILLCGSMLALALAGILCADALSAAGSELRIAGLLIVLSQGIKALDLSPIYDAWGRMKRHALYLLAERCLYFACIWMAVFFYRGSFSVPVIAVVMLVSTCLGLVLQYYWALPHLQVRIHCETLSLAVRMLRSNLWVWSAILATLSYGGLSKIMLKHISGSGELGSYAVAWQVVTLGTILIAQVARVGNPRMVSIVLPAVPQKQRLRFVLKYGALSVFAGAVIGLPAICFPATILRIFRPEYVSAEASLRILGVYVIVVGIGQVSTQYLIAIKREGVYSVVVILTGALSLLLFCLWIPRWSSAGAALAVLLPHGIAIAIYSAVMFHHVLTHDRGQ